MLLILTSCDQAGPVPADQDSPPNTVDPGETSNVAGQHPEVVAAIESLADEMRRDLGDSLRGLPGPGRRPVGRLD